MLLHLEDLWPPISELVITHNRKIEYQEAKTFVAWVLREADPFTQAMFVTYDISWYDEDVKPGPKMYPFSPEYTRGAFKIEYERCKDFYKTSGASLNAIKWLAQYVFWYKHEKLHRIPWSGGVPPYKGEDLYADGFGPAICMWTPDDWAFDPSFTDCEMQALDISRYARHDIEILEQLAVGLDEDGEIVRVGIWGNNETQKRLGQKDLWIGTYAHVDQIASEKNGWEDFEVYFTHLEGFDLRYKTFEGFHPPLKLSDVESHISYEFRLPPSPARTLIEEFNDRDKTPYDYEELDTDAVDEINTGGGWASAEIFPEHLQSIPESHQPKTIPHTQPKTISTYNIELETIQLSPAPDTALLGFETTKLLIFSPAQEILKSNSYRELSSLEEKSQARILVFDPFRAQDGKVSDTALVFIQGSPYARYQAVKLLTAFQANLEAGSIESNVNFTFLGPGRSRGRKKNGQKRTK